MDIGVGSFVFAVGITNASEYLRNPNGFPLKFHWRVVKSFRKSIPVLILGAIRVIMVKGVEYPVRSRSGTHR
jgi:phosphatidylinositol glycan class W